VTYISDKFKNIITGGRANIISDGHGNVIGKAMRINASQNLVGSFANHKQNFISARNNLVLGGGCGEGWSESANNCVVIGIDVPGPKQSNVIRIGSGDVYLEITKDRVAVVGADTDNATQAILDGLICAIDMVRP
jgi:hypothetical protein